MSSGKRAVSFFSARHLALALFTAIILLPISVSILAFTHYVDPALGSKRRRLTSFLPVKRLPSWTWTESLTVTLVYYGLVLCGHLEQLSFTPPMEQLISRLSRLLVGVRHQGWQMQCETVIIPRIPTSEVEAEQVEPHISRSKLERAQTLEALAYRQGLSSILQGQLKRGSMPVPCTAVWLWKTQAAKVKNGTIVAVKPDAEHGGLGCGPAGDDERVILLLAGSGLNENGPLVAPLAWTMTRQSGLRMFILKVRKMSHTSGSETFSAPLQDALAGYAYLVDRLGFLPRNITLLGEGAGASLCVALTLYLSAVSQMEEVEVALGRPGKMLLFSPWCDMTVSADILRQYSHFDVIDLSARLRSRARYISTFQQSVGEDKVDDLLQGLCSRYQVREGMDFALLGSELAETVESLGAVHPLVSPGMPIACNGYTELAMQLLGTQSGPPLGIFICAGSAQAHITEARSLAANLSSIQGVEIDYIEGEDKVTGFPFITASAAKTKVIKLCQAFLSN